MLLLKPDNLTAAREDEGAADGAVEAAADDAVASSSQSAAIAQIVDELRRMPPAGTKGPSMDGQR